MTVELVGKHVESRANEARGTVRVAAGAATVDHVRPPLDVRPRDTACCECIGDRAEAVDARPALTCRL
jgi:hypothetical protein